MKAPRACRQCRESKRKCVRRRRAGESCEWCQHRSLKCSVELPKGFAACSSSLFHLTPTEDGHPQTVTSKEHGNPAVLPKATIAELVELYLDKVHNRPHSIFHPPTLRAQLSSGSLSKPLIFALCAVGAKFSASPDHRRLEAQLTAEAKKMLLADLENICMENIQTCILVAILCSGNCQMSTEALFIRKRPAFTLVPRGTFKVGIRADEDRHCYEYVHDHGPCISCCTWDAY
jgi:hypothetical protein